MPFPKKHYIIGSVLAATGVTAFVFLSKIRPAERPWKYRSIIRNTTDAEAATSELPISEFIQPELLNQEEFTKCRVRRSEYETPDTKRLSVECPIPKDFHIKVGDRKNGELCFTNFIVREPNGSEKKYFPVFQSDDAASTNQCSKELCDQKSINFDILVERKKTCQNSMFLHAVYPDELIDIKGPYVHHIPDFQTREAKPSVQKSLWDRFFGNLKQNYNQGDVSARRYFIVSGTDGLSQVYSAILQLMGNDQNDNREVDNFLLLSAESVSHIPLIDELGGNLTNRVKSNSSMHQFGRDVGRDFYQYITLSQPRWRWQGGYGKIDRDLLKGVIGSKFKNESIDRDVMMVVAGSDVFKTRIQKELIEGLHYTLADMRFLE